MDLLGIDHSPWTERARWALDHHRLAYTFRLYTPIIDEAGLRWRLRRATGKVTVPVLFAPEGAITESLAIVRYAEERGTGAPLLPRELEADILAWNDRAEVVFGAARSMFVRAMLANPEALAETVPSFVPAALSGPSARLGVALFQRKHAIGGRSKDDDQADVARVLDVLRAALPAAQQPRRDQVATEGDYLLGRFTLADVVMAAAIGHVWPVDHPSARMSAPVRACSSHPELRDRYPDVVAWRDRIYARHRGGSS